MSDRPDPLAVGPAVMASYALHNALEENPAEVLGWAADYIATKLEARPGPNIANPLPPQKVETAIKEAVLVLKLVAEVLGYNGLPIDDEAGVEWKATLSRRKEGAPVNKMAPQSLEWWVAAGEVEKLIASGKQQKAALSLVSEARGIGTTKLKAWLKERRDNEKRGRQWWGLDDDSG